MKRYIFLLLPLLLPGVSCNKETFLDAKPNTGIVIPATLPELRALLDNTDVFPYTPALGEISADNYYLSYTTWLALPFKEHAAYTWEKDIYGAIRQVDDWSIPYQQVLYANIVMEQLATSVPETADLAEWKDLKGSALFLRAYAFFNLVQHFAPAYDSATADTDPGIPLRLQSDIHQLAGRASIKETYNQVFSDLAEALNLLSGNVHFAYRNRPSKPAAFALLSRVCMVMRSYEKAGMYADSCLALYNKLINYNSVSLTATTPFDKAGDENIYFSEALGYTLMTGIATTTFIDTLLYQSYAANDLRKSLYFRAITGSSNMGIKRGYTGNVLPFTGLATDEVYLNRAECFARAGNMNAALTDLNTLLSKRWKTGTYIPVTAISATDALNKILVERRKELVWRCLRWADLKRLNKEGSAITITRILNGQLYSLPPNSPLYVLPIPDNEIGLSGIQQNPR